MALNYVDLPIGDPDFGKPPKREVTEAMLAANRLNCLSSTGPTSESGKARSSANSTKHSLSCNGKNLERSHPELFHRYHSQYLDEFQPTTEEQQSLVVILARACVRMDLHDHTEESAVAYAIATRMRNWESDREKQADETLKRLDRPESITPRLHRAWLEDYYVAHGLRERLLQLAAQIEKNQAVSPVQFDRFLKLTGLTDSSKLDAVLPKTLQPFARLMADPEQTIPLTPDQRGRLNAIAQEQLTILQMILTRLDVREEELKRHAAKAMIVADDSKASMLRHRYYMEAERTFFRAIRQLRGESPRAKNATRSDPAEAGMGMNLPFSSMPPDQPPARPRRDVRAMLEELEREDLAEARALAQAIEAFEDAEQRANAAQPIAPVTPSNVTPPAPSANAAPVHGFVSLTNALDANVAKISIAGPPNPSAQPGTAPTGGTSASNATPPTPATGERPTPWTVTRNATPNKPANRKKRKR